MEKMLKVSEVAARFNVGHQTVMDWIKKGTATIHGPRRLGAVRVGGSWRVPEIELEAFIGRIEDDSPPAPKKRQSARMRAQIAQECADLRQLLGMPPE